MDDEEYDALEMKAHTIVGTLNALKEEIEAYKQAKIDTEDSLESLNNLIEAVARASDELAETAKEIKQSDYASLHDNLSKREKDLSHACEAIQASASSLPEDLKDVIEAAIREHNESESALLESLNGKIEEFGASLSKFEADLSTSFENLNKLVQQQNESILNRLSALEDVVGRIDRNTQKGFGKEKG